MVKFHENPPIFRGELAQLVDEVRPHRVLDLLKIQKPTLARWLSGGRIPHSAVIALRAVAHGRLPGMGPAWEEFHFQGDRLHWSGTRYAFTAREIQSLPTLWQALDIYDRALADRDAKIRALVASQNWGCANDPFSHLGDVRARGFGAP